MPLLHTRRRVRKRRLRRAAQSRKSRQRSKDRIKHRKGGEKGLTTHEQYVTYVKQLVYGYRDFDDDPTRQTVMIQNLQNSGKEGEAAVAHYIEDTAPKLLEYCKRVSKRLLQSEPIPHFQNTTADFVVDKEETIFDTESNEIFGDPVYKQAASADYVSALKTVAKADFKATLDVQEIVYSYTGLGLDPTEQTALIKLVRKSGNGPAAVAHYIEDTKPRLLEYCKRVRAGLLQYCKSASEQTQPQSFTIPRFQNKKTHFTVGNDEHRAETIFEKESNQIFGDDVYKKQDASLDYCAYVSALKTVAKAEFKVELEDESVNIPPPLTALPTLSDRDTLPSPDDTDNALTRAYLNFACTLQENNALPFTDNYYQRGTPFSSITAKAISTKISRAIISDLNSFKTNLLECTEIADPGRAEQGAINDLTSDLNPQTSVVKHSATVIFEAMATAVPSDTSKSKRLCTLQAGLIQTIFENPARADSLAKWLPKDGVTRENVEALIKAFIKRHTNIDVGTSLTNEELEDEQSRVIWTERTSVLSYSDKKYLSDSWGRFQFKLPLRHGTVRRDAMKAMQAAFAGARKELGVLKT